MEDGFLASMRGWAVEGEESQRSETGWAMASAEPIMGGRETVVPRLGTAERSPGKRSDSDFEGRAVEENVLQRAEVVEANPPTQDVGSSKGASAFESWAAGGEIGGGVREQSSVHDLPRRESAIETGSESPKASSARAKSRGISAEELEIERAFIEDLAISSPGSSASSDDEDKRTDETVVAGPATSVPREKREKDLASSSTVVNGSKDGRSSVDEEEDVKIEYFCPPNQNRTSDSWKIMVFQMLPFTTVPQMILLALLAWACRRWGWAALAIYATSCALLAVSPCVYSRRLRASISDYFYGPLARYVPSAQFAVPRRPFPPNRPYIFACHPHGRMFYSTIIFSQRDSFWRSNILRTGDLFMTAAGPFFFVPILRSLFYLVGAIPAGKAAIIAKLRNKDHVTILVGGVKEVLLGTQEDADRLYLKKRKGFCKIAIQENAGVVPVYFFNENQLFRHNSQAFLRFWERVNRHVKIGVPFMRGRYFILPMPFRRPLLIAVGEPLFPETGESVDAFHGRYIQALEQLFAKYLPHSPTPLHKLIIT